MAERQFVGYAEDSFTPSEFDLTPFLREKGNVLAVQVHKMSTAAFLEDQDFFRFFGISETLPCVRFLRSIWRMCGSARNCIRIMRAANYP